jgi:hypothetical protein
MKVTKDLSSQLGTARDQGRRPTCVAFATSDLHAAVRDPAFSQLSVEYLYYHACKLVSPFDPHTGVTLDQILKAVETDGQPEEVHWPYLPQLPTDLITYRPPSIAGTIYRRSGHLIHAPAVDGINQELSQDRPSMLVFRSTLGFLTALAGNPVNWTSTDQMLSPHAVVAVAMGDNGDERFVRVRNSWGVGWAEGGHAWLSEEYVQKTFIALIRMV